MNTKRSEIAADVGNGLFAALDLGTNNCRLLVAQPTQSSFRVVDSFSRIVRLGEGLARTGRLAERAMRRTLAALKVCRRIVERHGVGGMRCVATEACRRAENGSEFLDRARRMVGFDIELLGHDEEARLALLGCLPLVDPEARQILLIDIGGGSTEVMWLDRAAGVDAKSRLGCAISAPMGVVTLSETFAGERSAYDLMVALVRERFEAMEREHRIAARLAAGDVQMIGTSGTVTTLAAVHLGLSRYERRKVDGVVMSFGAIAETSARLRNLDPSARSQHPCIGGGRADLVLAGCAILDAAHEVWPVGRLRVADRGVREGLLNGMMGRSLRDILRHGAAEPAGAMG